MPRDGNKGLVAAAVGCWIVEGLVIQKSRASSKRSRALVAVETKCDGVRVRIGVPREGVDVFVSVFTGAKSPVASPRCRKAEETVW